MQGVGFARRPCAFQLEDQSSRHYQDRQECVILGTTHAYPAQVIQHTLWRMASAAKHVKHPPKHIRNHMQHIYKGLHKHANITLTCLHDCMSLYTYFRNHSSTTGTWPNFWQTVFNFWQLTHQGDCARWGAFSSNETNSNSSRCLWHRIFEHSFLSLKLCWPQCKHAQSPGMKQPARII